MTPNMLGRRQRQGDAKKRAKTAAMAPSTQPRKSGSKEVKLDWCGISNSQSTGVSERFSLRPHAGVTGRWGYMLDASNGS